MTFSVFLILNNKLLSLVINHLNSLHPNLKFSLKFENSSSLSFLDVLITRSNNQFSTSVYRKSTNTPLSINFYSFSYMQYKLSSVKALIYRAYHVSSSYDFHTEIIYLVNYFSLNGFPTNLVFKLISNFLQNIFHPNPLILTAHNNHHHFFHTKFLFLGSHYSKLFKEYIQLPPNTFLNIQLELFLLIRYPSNLSSW